MNTRGVFAMLVSMTEHASASPTSRDGTVSVIDVATQNVCDTFQVGKGPNGITFRSVPR